jgi:PPM family protein phosphatase
MSEIFRGLRRKEPLQGSVEIGTKSVPSEYHTRNEDSILLVPGKKTAAIFDGMGGVAGGERASSLARHMVGSRLQTLPDGLTAPQLQSILAQILSGTNSAIYREGQADYDYRGMGTTATVVKLADAQSRRGQQEAIIANVGDSRAYILRAGGRATEQITLDDAMQRQRYGEQEARRMQIETSYADDPDTVERGHIEGRRIITQALGQAHIEPRLEVVEVNPGDRFILTSDGVHDNLTDREIFAAVSQARTAQNAAERLVGQAQVRSKDNRHPRHKDDDMSAIVMVVGGEVKDPTLMVKRIPGGSPQRPIDTRTRQPERLTTIGDARSFDDLYGAIDRIGSIRGSQQDYSADTLRRLIDEVRSGRRSIDYITNTNNLRLKVEELLDRERRGRRGF